MKTKLKTKGYIGAIGDDLPSLIPIFLGITIFFSVFLSTYNVYRNNTDLYSIKNDAINISGILKEEPLYSDSNAFFKTCDKIKTKYNWNAFVIPLDLNTDNYQSLEVESLRYDSFIKHWDDSEGRPFFCGNTGIDILISSLRTKDVIVYRFPVTVQQEFFVEPTWLYVMVWK